MAAQAPVRGSARPGAGLAIGAARSARSGAGLAVAIGAALATTGAAQAPWCANKPQANWTVCDPTASLDARAADIVARLSLADKIASLGTSTPSLPSVGLPAYQWWSEAAHGISHVRYTPVTPYASNTVIPVSASQSFNRTLWHATGAQIGREARAFMNAGTAGGGTYWAPVINIIR